jgi:hypothetical protein
LRDRPVEGERPSFEPDWDRRTSDLKFGPDTLASEPSVVDPLAVFATRVDDSMKDLSTENRAG